jgi:hypothetical protein
MAMVEKRPTMGRKSTIVSQVAGTRPYLPQPAANR